MRPVKFTLGAMLGNDVIDQLVRDLVSAVLELIDLGRYERLVGQLAQLHMPWRVHGDHRRLLGQRVIFALQRRSVLGGTERAYVLQQRIDIVVTRYPERDQLRYQLHRLVSSHYNITLLVLVLTTRIERVLGSSDKG